MCSRKSGGESQENGGYGPGKSGAIVQEKPGGSTLEIPNSNVQENVPENLPESSGKTVESLWKSGRKVSEIAGKCFQLSVEILCEAGLGLYEAGEKRWNAGENIPEPLTDLDDFADELGIDLGEVEETCLTRCENPLVYIGAKDVVCQCSTWNEVEQ